MTPVNQCGQVKLSFFIYTHHNYNLAILGLNLLVITKFLGLD